MKILEMRKLTNEQSRGAYLDHGIIDKSDEKRLLCIHMKDFHN